MNEDVEKIKKYVRAANYITAAQIYLKDNFLLERKLSFDDIKPRLLGHWGTCPGINFIYANLNYLVTKHRLDMMFVLGPGHGFPALQANLFMEGTLGKFYPNASQNEAGLGYVCKNFSWPGGFPSHSNPGTPGVILEGGELGYALSTSYGAVLDNPDLIVACMIGDGEAETGPTATAWHLNKFINPASSGAVLPILHLNGYKISGPTILGRMSNRELKALFTGYGYKPYIVEGKNVYEKMPAALEECYQLIKTIQSNARGGDTPSLLPMPMIILKTPKGWTGIKKLNGKKIEDNFASHQVVAPNAKTERAELRAVEKWLRSYKIEELFDKDGGLATDVRELIPEPGYCLGENKHTLGGPVSKDLVLPPAEKFAEDASQPGIIGSSSMRRSGLYLKEVFQLNAENKNFRLMSPDETYSNKLDAIFETTSRAFMLPVKEWDKDLSPNGRVMEMLSEHSLQGLMQGYVLTGRHAVFASYEAFIPIVTSMVDQYAKFLSQAREVTWRGAVPSLNYILTSSGWRQEHNGFSHQNPGFINDMLQRQGNFTKVYMPPDGNSALAVLKKCLESKNGINVIVAGKTLEPRWLTPELSQKELQQGLMVWDFASDAEPDVVVSAAGDYMTKEALAAIDTVKKDAPEIKIRFVNIMELSSLGIGAGKRQDIDFDNYFTSDKPVIFNFHGYPDTLKQNLFHHCHGHQRFFVYGYIENGSTTTPFDMQVRNKTSRYHLAMEIVASAAEKNVIGSEKSKALIERYDGVLKKHAEYIKQNGLDMPEIENWTFSLKK